MSNDADEQRSVRESQIKTIKTAVVLIFITTVPVVHSATQIKCRGLFVLDIRTRPMFLVHTIFNF